MSARALGVVLVAVAAVSALLVLEMADPRTFGLADRGTTGQGLDPFGNAGHGVATLAFSTLKPALVLGDPATSGRERWMSDVDAYPVKAYDFDGDGVDEVVVHANDTHVLVFHGKTGRVLADLTTTYPPGWYLERVLNGVEAARLAPGEPPSIVVTNHAAYVSVWQFVPSQSDGQRFAFAKRWEHRLDLLHASPSMDSKPVLADLDGDGDAEILAQTEELGVYALRHDGTVMWKLGIGGGNAEPAVGDLDGDGQPEVVFASDAGVVTAVDGKAGRIAWAFDARGTGVSPASIPVAPTIADLDGKPPSEVLFTARDAHDEHDFAQDHMAVFAVRGVQGKGSVVWVHQATWANPLSYTHLIAHDLEGDGRPEVLGMDWNTFGHIPGDWEHTGPAHVFALDARGEERWVRELDAWWSNKDLALLDIDGDGRLEVLANGPAEGADGLWVFDARSGKAEGFLSAWPWKVERGPALADLWGKGTTQLLLPVRPVDEQGAPRGAVLVYDLGAAWDAPWPGYPPPFRAR
jgi:outer membrane protein assembly factor BamB